MLDVSAVKDILLDTVETIRAYRGKTIPMIFTVSPVGLGRTYREGISRADANQQSKDTLRLAAKGIVSQEDGIYYYDSYEVIVSDPNPFRKDGRHPRNELIHAATERFMRETGLRQKGNT